MIKEIITKTHQEDKDQLDFIFSDADHISVIAPAGSGKTTAMISKIAYELGDDRVPLNKKILAMTFSVSGALKIREAVELLLPEMVDNVDTYIDKIDIANYHRFAVQLITKHGYSINHHFTQFREFQIVDDNAFCKNYALNEGCQKAIDAFSEVLNRADNEHIEQALADYWRVIVYGIDQHVITYNGLLVAAILLLRQDNIRHFYSSFYSIIIIDEFQDTNILGYMIVRLLIEKNRSIFLGDGMQKIYGFIGALPNAFSQLKADQDIVEYRFKKNYRFSKSEMMKSLDAHIRNCCERYQPNSEKEAAVYFRYFRTEQEENEYVISSVTAKLCEDKATIAILVRAAYQGTSIANMLTNQGIPYFNALYKESDPEYIAFHSVACEEFHSVTHETHKATKRNLDCCLSAIQARKGEICKKQDRQFVFDSLFKLLTILFSKSKQWPGTPYDRYTNIDFVLGNYGLKHMMEYLDESIVLTTIHSAKGLEWDYVFVVRVMAYSFPANKLCMQCKELNGPLIGKDFCMFRFIPEMKKLYQEELSVFYVALTRARKMVYLSANSGPNKWGYPQKRSCFTCLPGLKTI